MIMPWCCSRVCVVKIAVPTVHVEGGGDQAAAAQQMLKGKQDAELAAAQAANQA